MVRKGLEVGDSSPFRHNIISKNLFMVLYDVGIRNWTNILKHINQHGAVPCCHGNTGRRHTYALSIEDTKSAETFISNYEAKHGWLKPTSPKVEIIIHMHNYLHCKTTKKTVHRKYETSLQEKSTVVIFSIFVKIWNNCLPHTRISLSQKNVCNL